MRIGDSAGARGDHRLRPHERIRRKEIFDQVFGRGKRIKSAHFTLIYKRNGLDHDRIGISVGRKYGNAVQRNRAKRRLRELFRLEKSNLPKGYDLVFIPRRGLNQLPWQELRREFIHATAAIGKGFKGKGAGTAR